MHPEDLTQLHTLLGSAQNVLILTGKTPDLDTLGASLALYLGLVRTGKTVTVACPETSTVSLSRLVGVDKVKTELGGGNLVVSFPYVEGSIEKVSYNIENNQFNLVIQPRSGAKPFSPETVKFSSRGGGNTDLIFVLGTRSLLDLGELYEKERELFEKVSTVVIDNHVDNKYYGRLNLVNPQASSTSELVGLLLPGLGLEIDADMAHNLLAGIDSATQNFFSPSTSVGAFEVAAACLKAGAKRSPVAPQPEEKGMRSEIPLSPLTPTPKPTRDLTEEAAPPDWLSPKVFKGSDLP